MEPRSSQEERVKKDEFVEKEYEASDSYALSINDAARGENLPDNYFLSVSFIGTVVGLCLAQIGAYIFLILPTNVLIFINEVVYPIISTICMLNSD